MNKSTELLIKSSTSGFILALMVILVGSMQLLMKQPEDSAIYICCCFALGWNIYSVISDNIKTYTQLNKESK